MNRARCFSHSDRNSWATARTGVRGSAHFPSELVATVRVQIEF